MKKIFAALSMICLLTPAMAEDVPKLTPAAQKALGYRRTLFASIGGENLLFEAPRNMCFLDKTSPKQAPQIEALRKAQKKADKFLLGVFTDCLALDTGRGPDEKKASVGFVSWLNPKVGEKIKTSQQDYLDQREKKLRDAVVDKESGSDIEVEPVTRRGENLVALGYSFIDIREDSKPRVMALAGSTEIHGFPLEVQFLRLAEGKAPYDLFPSMEKFVAQQVALNR